jgi:hypothetical protein
VRTSTDELLTVAAASVSLVVRVTKLYRLPLPAAVPIVALSMNKGDADKRTRPSIGSNPWNRRNRRLVRLDMLNPPNNLKLPGERLHYNRVA